MAEVNPKNNIKRHISPLHEKIQRKYSEMQKRLEKSRSLTNLSDMFGCNESMCYSEIDVSKLENGPVFNNNARSQSITFEEVPKQIAVRHDVEYIEASFAEVENNNEGVKDNIEDEVFGEKIEEEPRQNYIEIHQKYGSTESLTKITNDSPSPRTMRQKIHFRFNTARERRKREEKEKLLMDTMKKELMLSNTKQEIKINRKNKLATVTVALIKLTGLEPTTDERVRFVNCKLRLGPEKTKSKTVKSNKSEAKWQELFNINMYDDLMLEIDVCDREAYLGGQYLDLSDLEKEKTHQLTLDLEYGEMKGLQVVILVTISGTASHSILEIQDLETAKANMHRRKDAWYNLEGDFSDVGRLTVIVYGAKGLAAQECYCVLKLGNKRLLTHTEYKTYDPNWMKIFTFELNDITSILEVIVYEEKRGEEVGRISLPLLRIHNGERFWYALKDSTQRERAKGNNPRILLEITMSWNLLKASLRVINPKEVDLLQTDEKLDRRKFARNLARAKAVINWTLDALKVIKTCFEWESRKSNAIALVIWIIFCWNFRIWMTPLLLLIPFVKYRPREYYLVNWRKLFKKEPKVIEVAKIEKEEKSSLIQKLNSLQEMIQSVQNSVGKFASFGESVKNLCNFTEPFVSFLAVFFILMITLVMYIIPLRFIFIGWGIHKFTRKILRPNRIPNSEILDLLSRVPDDETMLNCEELPLESLPEEDEIY